MKSISCAPTNYADRNFLQIQCKSSPIGNENTLILCQKEGTIIKRFKFMIQSVHRKFLRVSKRHDYNG